MQSEQLVKPLLIAFVFFSFLSWGQTEELSGPIGSFSAIIVKDMTRSKSWYEKVLGFKVLTETENTERGIKIVNLENSMIQLELIELANTTSLDQVLAGLPKGSRLSGFFKFGFKVAGFDRWVAYLKETDANNLGRVVNDPVSGKRMLILKDPDGNRIQLFEK